MRPKTGTVQSPPEHETADGARIGQREKRNDREQQASERNRENGDQRLPMPSDPGAKIIEDVDELCADGPCPDGRQQYSMAMGDYAARNRESENDRGMWDLRVGATGSKDNPTSISYPIE
jgi:hypothetical protein